jgi:hypothetical protein
MIKTVFPCSAIPILMALQYIPPVTEWVAKLFKHPDGRVAVQAQIPFRLNLPADQSSVQILGLLIVRIELHHDQLQGSPSKKQFSETRLEKFGPKLANLSPTHYSCLLQ